MQDGADAPDEETIRAIVREEIENRAGGATRRQTLQAGGALGLGALLGGGGAYAATDGANADASTSDGDGDVGTPSDRVDVFADDVDVGSVTTEDLEADQATIGEGTGDTSTFDGPAVFQEGIGTSMEDANDVTDSRSFDTEYQNNEQSNLYIFVRVVNGTGGEAEIDAYISVSNTSGQTNNENSQGIIRSNAAAEGDAHSLTAIVPPGAYYSVASFGDETLDLWTERAWE